MATQLIGAQFRSYVILGACNPQLPHHALSEESSVVARPDLKPTARAVKERLARALAGLA